jgi:hypothetical protein
MDATEDYFLSLIKKIKDDKIKMTCLIPKCNEKVECRDYVLCRFHIEELSSNN